MNKLYFEFCDDYDGMGGCMRLTYFIGKGKNFMH